MSSLPVPVADAIQACRSRIKDHWGDVGSPIDEVIRPSHPLWRVLEEIAQANRGDGRSREVEWLVLFVARRVLPCWELYCDSDRPRRTVEAIARVLGGSTEKSSLNNFLTPSPPAYRGIAIVDCRACDTSCAAECIAHAAHFVLGGELNESYLCLGYADMAFDQSPLNSADHFRIWLLDVAIPTALEGREMTSAGSQALRDYDASQISIERERAACQSQE